MSTDKILKDVSPLRPVVFSLYTRMFRRPLELEVDGRLPVERVVKQIMEVRACIFPC